MKKIYFASDFHLGLDARLSSLERERQICRWLDMVSHDAAAIYLVGDVFDFWFEYKSVIPKGFSRILGKLAEIRDKGIPVHFFIGNHDMWMFRYFEDEMGIPIHRKPLMVELEGKIFFIAHGDGLGPNDYGYKIIKKIFSNKVCQWLFARIHPNFGLWLMRFASGKSRQAQDQTAEMQFLGEQNEWLLAYCQRKIESIDVDYFVFGHRHLPIDWMLKNQKTRYINLGEWMYATTYAVFDGKNISIQTFDNEHVTVYKNY